MSWVAVAIGGSAVLGAYSANKASNKQQASADRASDTQLGMFNQTQANLAPWMNTGRVALSALARKAGVGADPASIQFGNQAAQNEYQRMLTDGNNQVSGDPTAVANQVKAGWGADYSIDPSGKSDDYGSLTKPFSMSDFQASPAYNFNLEQGQQAIDKAAAARHNFYAPATLQQISKYSQGLASNEFQNAYSNYNTNLKNVWDRLYALSGSGQNAAAQTGAFGTTVGGQVGENQIGAGNAAAAGQIGQANAISSGVGSYFNNQLLSQYLSNQQRSSVSPNMGSAGANDIPSWMNA